MWLAKLTTAPIAIVYAVIVTEDPCRCRSIAFDSGGHNTNTSSTFGIAVEKSSKTELTYQDFVKQGSIVEFVPSNDFQDSGQGVHERALDCGPRAEDLSAEVLENNGSVRHGFALEEHFEGNEPA